jgi:hypothetical protein
MNETEYNRFVREQKLILHKHINTKLDELAAYVGLTSIGRRLLKIKPIVFDAEKFNKSMQSTIISMNELRAKLALPPIKE